MYWESLLVDCLLVNCLLVSSVGLFVCSSVRLICWSVRLFVCSSHLLVCSSVRLFVSSVGRIEAQHPAALWRGRYIWRFGTYMVALSGPCEPVVSRICAPQRPRRGPPQKALRGVYKLYICNYSSMISFTLCIG